SDSRYNEKDLLSAGADASHCRVVPPFHWIERLLTLEPDADVLNACRDGRTNILFVGRVVPNKGHTFLIEAFAVYHHHYNSHRRLRFLSHSRYRRFGGFGLDRARSLPVRRVHRLVGARTSTTCRSSRPRLEALSGVLCRPASGCPIS